MRDYIITFLLAALLMAASFYTGSRFERRKAKNGPDAEVMCDTVEVIRTDTIVEIRPVYATRTVIDTMLVALTDTLTLRDTTYLAVEMEQRVYEDSLYRAVVSGYRPALDSLSFYPRTIERTVTEVVTETYRSRWGIGIELGYGAYAMDYQIGFAPYIGVGLHYSLFSW